MLPSNWVSWNTTCQHNSLGQFFRNNIWCDCVNILRVYLIIHRLMEFLYLWLILLSCLQWRSDAIAKKLPEWIVSIIVFLISQLYQHWQCKPKVLGLIHIDIIRHFFPQLKKKNCFDDNFTNQYDCVKMLKCI